MKKILITGGAGFIGSNLAKQLSAQGHHVTVLDNLSSQVHGEEYHLSPTYRSVLQVGDFIRGDVTSRADMEKAVAGKDVIIHLAAETGTGQSMYEIERYNKVNVNGTALLLDVLVNRCHRVAKLVLASSRAVYGEGMYETIEGEYRYPGPRQLSDLETGRFEHFDKCGGLLQAVATSETSCLHPVSFYGITKLHQEQMVRQVCESIGLPYAILRFQNVYGEGQSLLNPYTGILSIFSSQILNNIPLNIFEDGKMTRDFIHISDVTEATIKAIMLKENVTSNVGSGQSTTVLDVATKLIAAYQKDVPIKITGQFRIGDIRHNFADVSRMETILQYKAGTALAEGMRIFSNWVVGEHVPKRDTDKSMVELKEKGFCR